MRFVTFAKAGHAALGVRHGEDLFDLGVAAPQLPQTLRQLLAAGGPALEAAAAAAKRGPSAAIVQRGGLSYLPPVPDPGRIICLGLNYAAHAAEAGMETPKFPIIFTRYASSVVGHQAPLVRPKVSVEFDYEAELVAVIGKRGRHVPAERALEIVAGYSAFNDGSLRDWQFKTTQWAPGKNFDRSGAFGPEMVTADELPPGADGLRISSRLNGRTMQDSDTGDLIFKLPEIIAFITEWLTLEPGDILVTGTPAGVGMVRDPKLWMKAGDVCEVEIEGIGILRNSVVDET